MEGWLDTLCAVVHCPLERPEQETESVGISSTDVAAVQVVLAYFGNGIREDLTLEQQALVGKVVVYTAGVLAANPGRLEPEVEEALELALSSMQAELSK